MKPKQTKQKTHDKVVAWILVLLALALIIVPFAMNSNAEFGGSDDAGSEMVEQVSGGTYKPWAEPLIEKAIGHELPSEIESLLFCVQTGIGVAILFYGFGYLHARNKYRPKEEEKKDEEKKK